MTSSERKRWGAVLPGALKKICYEASFAQMTEGRSAPHRSLMKALGWIDSEIHMPIIGIVSGAIDHPGPSSIGLWRRWRGVTAGNPSRSR